MPLSIKHSKALLTLLLTVFIFSVCLSQTTLAAVPAIFDYQCENNTDGAINIAIDAGSNSSSRAVILTFASEGDPSFPTSAIFDNGGTNQAMTLLGQSYINYTRFDSLAEIWAVLDADLPSTAGTFSVSHNGGTSTGALCALSLINVAQNLPLNNVTTPNGGGGTTNINYEVDGSVSGIPSPSDNTISTQITLNESGSMVISITENGNTELYNTQLNQLYNVYTGDPTTGAVITVAAEVINSTGAYTITDTASADTNRQAQVVTAFAPFANSPANAFKITHNNTVGVCRASTITFSAVDSSGSTDTNYLGTITVNADSNQGKWSLSNGSGSFNNNGNGIATYTFVTSDNGTVELNFEQASTGSVNFNVSDGTLSESVLFDNNLNIEDCQFRISTLVGSLSNSQSCLNASDTVTISLVDSNGNAASNYTGNIEVSTDSSNGNWVSTTGSGTLTDINPDDGFATYQFVSADNGSVELVFTNNTIETVNINVNGNGTIEDSNYDPDLDVIPCTPSIKASACYQNGDPGRDIAISSSIQTERSRMLLAFINSEAEVDVSSVSINGGLGNFTFIRREKNTDAAGNTLEVWGMLDQDLPATAGSYVINFTGATNNPAICLISLEGVQQVFPLENTALAERGQINSSQGTTTQIASTSIRTEIDNSLILSAVSTGHNGSTYSSSLSTSLWSAGNANPFGAEFYGNAEIQVSAGNVTVNETNSATDTNRHTHMVLAIAPKGGTPANYVPVDLFQTFSGNINYRAIGNSLRNASNYSNSCSFVNTAIGSTSQLAIPSGSTIISAYLYWAASGSTADIDQTVSFGPDGSQISVTADDIFQIINPFGGSAGRDFFLGYKDVTGLITNATSTTYRLSDLTVQNDSPWNLSQTCLGGWGLVAVYENPLEALHTINLFHGFQPFQHSAFTLVPRNFRMATPDLVPGGVPNGQISHITFEGDDSLNSDDEAFRLQNTPGTSSFDTLENSYNLFPAQYNDTVTYPVYDSSLDFVATGGPNSDGYALGSSSSYGTDVDTYYLKGAQSGDLLYSFGLANVEEITTRYSAGQDLVLLAGEFISIVSSPIADMEVFINESGSFEVNSFATSTYQYTVRNNGQGLSAPGYANGEALLTVNLPTGMTINSLSAPNGWDCPLQTSSAFTCFFDIANNWTGGSTNGQLAGGESLPVISVSLNIADASTYPSLNNTVSHVARLAHTGGSCPAASAGVQPSPDLCLKSPQYDNVNDLDGGNLDINNIDMKTLNNNNVDSLSTLVKGVETNLSIEKSVVGVLQEGQTAQYQISVTNLGPDSTNSPYIVTDTLPPGLQPVSAYGSNWSCSISGQDVTCTGYAPLAINETASFSIYTSNLTAPAVAGVNISNTAVVTPAATNFDQDLSNNSSTNNTQVLGLVTAAPDKFLMSVNESSSIAGLGPFNDGDLVLYDPANDSAEMFLEESALTASNLNNINAVHVLPNGHIVLSSENSNNTLVGLTFDQSDLVLYDPILKTAQLVFDGSAVFTGSANIDAIFVEYNNSYTPADWDLLISTVDTAIISGNSFNDNDLFQYDISSGNAYTILSGSSGAVFSGSDGDIDAIYKREEIPGAYILSTDDAATDIGIYGSEVNFSQDDLLEYNSQTIAINTVFEGDQAPGIFTANSATRKINAAHVVENAYFGHFSIDVYDGDTCSASTITLRKHGGLGHSVETFYEGSVLISNNINAGVWAKDASAQGTISDQGNGAAIYTFADSDNGEVILYLTHTTPINNVNVDISTGINFEYALEDESFDINESISIATYLDQFSNITYNNDDGTRSFSDNWTEINDGISSPSSGNISIALGKLSLTNPSGANNVSLLRSIDFSSYTPATTAYPLSLSFLWGRSNGAPADSFVVEAKSQSSDSTWTTLQTISGYTGGISERLVSLDLTAAGISPTATTQIQFRINNGYVLENFTLDNVQVETATTDCGTGAVVDHYAISHSGNGISCLIEDVTITAHTAAHVAVAPGSSTILQFSTSTNKGTWFQPTVGSGSFSAGAIGSGVAQYTFAAGESTLTLPFNYTDISPANYTETLNLNVVDNFVRSESISEDPDLIVSRAGLRFYNETTMNTTMPNLIAGRASNHTAAPYNLVVQAVRASDDNPAMCEPIFSENSLVELDLAFECINPNTCTGSGYNVEAIAIDPITSSFTTTSIAPVDDNGASAATSAGYQSIEMRFQTQASGDIGARFALNYADAGSLQIHGRYNIELLEGVGADSDNFMLGSSSPFVIRPFAFDLDFMDDRRSNTNIALTTSYANDANGSVFIGAGEAFSTTVKAVVWAQDDDLDNNGIPDFEADLSNNNVTPNFGNETGFGFEVKLSVITDNPNIIGVNDNPGVPGGVIGTINQLGSYDAFVNGISTGVDTTSIDEVGIFDLHALMVDNLGLAATYLGFEGIEGGVANVGRITPSYYDLGATVITSRPNFPTSSSTFTYLGEEFNIQLELHAKNAAGNTTLNYFDDYAKLNTPSQLSFYALKEQGPNLADDNYSSRLSQVNNTFPSNYSSNWSSGIATIDGNLILSREIASGKLGGEEEAPLTNISIALTALDSDSISDGLRDVNIDDGSNENINYTYRLIDTNNFRYGRLRIENSYASEIPELDSSLVPIGKDLDINLVAEYWDGSQFMVSEDDSNSSYSSDELSFVAGSYTDDLDAGEATIITGINGIVYQGLNKEINTTDRILYIQAPGEGNDGSAVIELDLDAMGLGFLEYDWRDEQANEIDDLNPNDRFINNPRAFIEFGEYRGNDRIINWQEIFVD